MKNKLLEYQQKFISKVQALKGTPCAIASGTACGVVVSLTPFVGLHTLLAVVVAWLIRANVLAATLGPLSAIRGHFCLFGWRRFTPDVGF